MPRTWLHRLRVLPQPLALLGLAAAVAACGEAAAPAAGRNLLLVTLDTTRADAVAGLGGDARTTPTLAALAGRGALFTRAYAETNVTNPSHLTLVTGLHAIEHGVVDNFTAPPPGTGSLVATLAREGYATAAFAASSHLSWVMGALGFDVYPPVADVLAADAVTDRALAWLDRARRGPFFAWVHYFDPHAPYAPPPDVAAAFYSGDPAAGEGPPLVAADFFGEVATDHLRAWLGEARDPAWPRAMYAGEVHFMDRELGRLLRGLEARGLADDTVLVVVADHGELLGEHGVYYDHRGLWEPNLHIPLLVVAPGTVAPRRIDAAVSTLDVAPTVEALLGVRLDRRPSGRSLLPLLRGAAGPPPAPLVHQNAHNHVVAVRDGPWKLLWPVNPAFPFGPGSAPVLYRLDQDPGEERDLAAQNADRVAAMGRHAAPWIELGLVPVQHNVDLGAGAREALRALGYVAD